jgi:hypothetical protein
MQINTTLEIAVGDQAPPSSESLRRCVGSYAGSIVFHALLLLVPISWFISASQEPPETEILITTEDSELGAPVELDESQVELEIESDAQEATADQDIFAMFRDEENELQLGSLPFKMPEPKSRRTSTTPTPNRKPSQSEQKADQPASSKSAIEKEVQKRLDKAGGQGGAIQISLVWNNGNDLDLYTQTPIGDIIAFAYKRSRCGGELDVDMNARKTQSTKPVENIFWSAKKAPMGIFTVGVNEYQNHRFRDPTPYLVSVRVDGEVHHFRGTARVGLPLKCVCRFKRTAEGVEFLKPPKSIGSGKQTKPVRK